MMMHGLANPKIKNIFALSRYKIEATNSRENLVTWY